MSFIEWTTKLDVPNEKINGQHHTLVDAINRLHEAVSGEADADAMTELLLFLTNYVGQHFSDEEGLMKAAGFPLLDEHHQTHQKLFLDVQARAGALIRGEPVDASELLDFLKDWLTDHILGTDMEMAAFVSEALGGG